MLAAGDHVYRFGLITRGHPRGTVISVPHAKPCTIAFKVCPKYIKPTDADLQFRGIHTQVVLVMVASSGSCRQVVPAARLVVDCRDHAACACAKRALCRCVSNSAS